jgi:class 3 adenylate cyclase
MSETRKIAAILVADIVGHSRLAGADEDRTLARLRALRSDLIDPTIAVHHGRIVKRTGDGSLIEFRSVVDAVRCAIEVQNGLVERNAGVASERRIEFRVGIHLGDVVEEADGDLMGDGVNIAARLEGICAPGAICLSEDAYRQVKGRLDLAVSDLGPTRLKNIAEPIRVYSLDVGVAAASKPAPAAAPVKRAPPRLSMVVLPFANIGGGTEQEAFVDGVTESGSPSVTASESAKKDWMRSTTDARAWLQAGATRCHNRASLLPWPHGEANPVWRSCPNNLGGRTGKARLRSERRCGLGAGTREALAPTPTQSSNFRGLRRRAPPRAPKAIPKNGSWARAALMRPVNVATSLIGQELKA